VEGRLRGEEITFTAGATSYRGRVQDQDMHVSATAGGRSIEWHARPVLRR
jgi:hypothetical protein